MEVTPIIISVLWMTLSLLAMIECAPYCKDLPKADQWTVGLILLIGGPILTIASVLQSILDCILPEGWSSGG